MNPEQSCHPSLLPTQDLIFFFESANALKSQFPVSDHIEKVSRAIRLILSGFDFISIGGVKLIKRDQMGTFLKAVRGVDKELSPYKTGKTEL